MSYTTIILIVIALLVLSWLQPHAIKNNRRREAERRKAERARERERARAARAARLVSARRTASPAIPAKPDAVKIAREYKIIANLILQSDKLTAQIKASERKGDGLADALKRKQDAINAEIEARQKKLKEI